MTNGRKRVSLAAAAATAVVALLPVTGGSAVWRTAVRAAPGVYGSYGHLSPGRQTDLARLSGLVMPSTVHPVVPFLTRNPAAFNARKEATAHARSAAPRVQSQRVQAGQGTVEELLGTFPGMDLAQGVNGIGNDQAIEPPDTQIAAGPSSVVETVNSNLSVWSKTGSRLQLVDLNAFYGLVSSGYYITDSRVLYDGQSGRFITSGVAIDSNYDSIVELAMSQTSDPTGAWTTWRVTTTTHVVADQPKIGTSDDKVTIAWADFDPTPCQGQSTFFCFAGELTNVFQKSDLLTNSSAPNVFATAADFFRFGFVPAQALSATTTQYMVYNNADPSSLVENQCAQTNPPPQFGPCPTIGEISITGTPAGHDIFFAEVDPSMLPTTLPPSAIQQGSATQIATGDDRFVSAVWENGRLWTSATDGNACSGGSCLHVVETNTDIGGMPVVLDNVIGPVGDYYYYPTVSLDNAGDAFVVFSESNGSNYPGVRFTGHLSTGGIWSMTNVLRAGLGFYDSQVAPCNGHNRWGDYSGAAIDPTDPTDVWIAGEYALISPNSCVWGTQIGRLTYSMPTVTSVTPATGPAAGATAVTITGTDFVSGLTTMYFGAATTPGIVANPDSVIASTPAGQGWVALSAATPEGHGPSGAIFKYPRVETGAPVVVTHAGSGTSGAPPNVPGSAVRVRPTPPPPAKHAVPASALSPNGAWLVIQAALRRLLDVLFAY